MGKQAATEAGPKPARQHGARITALRVSSTIIGVLAFAGSAAAGMLTPFAYVANAADSSVSAINTSTNAVVATIPLPEGWPATQLAAAPDGKFVYTASVFSGVAAIDTATNSVAWQVPLSSPITEVPRVPTLRKATACRVCQPPSPSRRTVNTSMYRFRRLM